MTDRQKARDKLVKRNSRHKSELYQASANKERARDSKMSFDAHLFDTRKGK